ncbi:MAG: Tol-Pal system beta propeller repeat protein TolB [Desulfosarcinaceae bacterium]|nr:Tol-Pal system beta propeller repeat protein TolB [Desulfosarcinaceae bacterium]
MRRLSMRLLRAATLCLLLFSTQAATCADYSFIDISNPFLRKIPLAVPLFKNTSGAGPAEELAVSSADMMVDALTFTGLFKLIDRGAYLEDVRVSGLVGPQIGFRNWTAVGAELLITGGLSYNGDLLEMELRLFDTFKEKLLVGKKYKGFQRDQRRMVLRFCSEVIYQLTGHRGVFDSRLAFISNGTGHKEIYTCDFDGRNVKRFTNHKSITLFPAWSSDGEWMAYTSYAKGKPDLYLRHLGNQKVRIVAEEGIQITPAWVPGRFELAATMSFGGDQEIYLLTGTGKIIKRLTKSRGIDVAPSWAPDGKRFAFVSRRSGTPQIYVQDASSGRVRRITYEGRYNTQPSWSPKGDKLAYSGLREGRINIYVTDLDGNLSMQLTDGSGDNEAPCWSPDGSLIAFSSTREGPSRLFVMTAHGTDQRRLLRLPGEQTNPRWSPGGLNYQ